MSRWHSLPRETRDTFYTLAVLAWIQFPQWPELPWWCAAGSGAILAWRAVLAWRGAPLPGSLLKGALAILAFAACAASASRWWGREMALLLIVILLSLKTLELKARRDAQVVFYLAFFVLMLGFLRSQSLTMALHGIVSVWLLLSLVVLSQRPAGRPPIKAVLRTASGLWLQGLPVMLLLFALFPRFEPLWGAPPTQHARSGLSDSLDLGSMQSPQIDESVAIEITGRWRRGETTPDFWYFRGMVLDDFDGRRWLAHPASPPSEARVESPPAQPAKRDPRVVSLRYEALEDQRVSRPEWWRSDDDRLRARGDGTWDLRDRPTAGSVLLQATPFAGPVRLLEPLRPGSPRWRMLTQAHAGEHPRLAQWVAQQGLKGLEAAEVIERVSRHLQRDGFRYTLDPRPYGQSGASTLDEFWLEGKEGFCEHYAASSATVLRMAGIPTRVVTGYQGAEQAAQDQNEIRWWVRQLQAHAWVEYWDGQGAWQRWDPTALVGSQRYAALRARRQAPAVWGVMGEASETLWTQWRMTWTHVEQQWRRWVVDHDEARQQSWWQQWRDWLPGGEPLWTAMGLLMLCTAGLWSLPEAWRQVRHGVWPWQGDPWLKAWRALCKDLAKQAREEAWPQAAQDRLDGTPTPRTVMAAVALSPWPAPRREALCRALQALEACRYGVQAGRPVAAAPVKTLAAQARASMKAP